MTQNGKSGHTRGLGRLRSQLLVPVGRWRPHLVDSPLRKRWGMGSNDLRLTASTQGVVIHRIPGPPGNEAIRLLMTHDAGASWQVVPIG